MSKRPSKKVTKTKVGTQTNPLSVAEKFYLEKNREVSAKELANTLSLSLAKVEDFLNSLPPLKRVTEEQVEAAQVKATTPENNMIKRRGAVVMTKAESERSDESKPKTTRVSRSYVTTARK